MDAVWQITGAHKETLAKEGRNVGDTPVYDRDTGQERLIQSHSAARFCFELSGNSN